MTALALLAAPAAAHATFPGQNGKIAVSAYDGAIHAVDPDGTDDAALASNAQGAQWSPDGTRIAFSRLQNPGCSPSCIFHVWVMSSDGTGQTQLTSGPDEFGAVWSNDGSKLLFVRRVNPSCSPSCDQSLWVMNPDGTAQTQLTDGPNDGGGQWFPDGRRILFGKGYPESGVWTVGVDGTGETSVLPGSLGAQLSPDGTRIVFSSAQRLGFQAEELYTANADGSDVKRITTVTPEQCDATPDSNFSPRWSPGGGRIVYVFMLDQYGCPEDPRPGQGIATVAPDGTGATVVVPQESSDQLEGPPMWSPDGAELFYDRVGETFAVSAAGGPERVVSLAGPPSDWQPLPSAQPGGYPRPKGARPFFVPLVPAFGPCTTPDRTHGAPLAYGSCSAPVPASADVTVGTPDANGKLPNARAFVQVDPQVGTPGGPDDTDVSIAAKLTSVYRSSDLSDYAGALEARLTIRRTDKDAGVSSTSLDFPLSATVPCAATADPDFGSTCAVVTSADAISPGSAPESRRTTWALDQVGVYDAGSDGDAATTADNRLFEAQGVFVP